ncbi:MAG: two-component system, cell cycle response regulator CpdR [Gaiellaceae bacterium]|nr:two-component system, cell cycle response regulator CpdR [Gaiellaceae bacterium]
MAQILISEPNADVRALFEHMVRRLGHKPLALWAVTAERAATIDLLVIEPADPRSRELAAQVRIVAPALPILAVSIMPPNSAELTPANGYLLKPVVLDELRIAIDSLLAAAPADSSLPSLQPA